MKRKNGYGQENVHIVDASDERQYLMNDTYEVYEKQGPPIGAVQTHCHNFYEIIYVLEGEYSSFVENTAYSMKKGDFLLISKNVMHRYRPMEEKHDSSRRIILWITPYMLQQLGNEEMDLAECFDRQTSVAYHFPIYYEELLQGFLLKLAMLEMQESKEKNAKKVLDRGYLILFFSYLNALCRRREYALDAANYASNILVGEVSEYIEDHMADRITVEELADYVHMSKYHFLRKFKDQTGITVHSFVNQKKLICALEELKTGATITESWQRAGFTDYSSYLRNFKHTFGVSPKEYHMIQ